MNRWSIALAIVSFLLALVIFIFADGLRRYYSSLFFVILGVALLVTERVRLRRQSEPGQEQEADTE